MFFAWSAVWSVLLYVSDLFDCRAEANKPETCRRTNQTADKARKHGGNPRKTKTSTKKNCNCTILADDTFIAIESFLPEHIRSCYFATSMPCMHEKSWCRKCMQSQKWWKATNLGQCCWFRYSELSSRLFIAVDLDKQQNGKQNTAGSKLVICQKKLMFCEQAKNKDAAMHARDIKFMLGLLVALR